MNPLQPIVLHPLPANLPAQDDYAKLVRANWNQGADLIIVEHDITPHDGVADGFRQCPADWCVYPYALTTRYAGYLGCVRFRAGMMNALPDAADVAAQLRWHSWQPGDWRSYADCLWQVLRAAGYEPHVHLPPVRHDNPNQQIRAELARGWCRWPVDLDNP